MKTTISTFVLFLFFFLPLHLHAQKELNKALFFESRFQVDSAQANFIRAIAKNPKGSLEKMKAHLGMARILNRKGAYNESIIHSDRVIDWVRELNDPIFFAQALVQKAYALNKKNQHQDAIGYLLQAISLIKSVKPSDPMELIKVYSLMGEVYYGLHDDELAQDYYFTALEMASLNGLLQNRSISQLYLNIASSYWVFEEYEKSNRYLKLAHQLERSFRYPDELLLGKIKHVMAYNFMHFKKYDSAVMELVKAEPLIRKSTGRKHPSMIWLYGDLGRAHYHLGKTDQALLFYQKSLAAGVVDFNDTLQVFANPELNNVIDGKQLIMVLKLKVQALVKKYEQQNDTVYLVQALKAAELGDAMIFKMKREMLAMRDKINIGNASIELYEQAIGASLKLYQISKRDHYLELAFNFSEKNKASVSLSAISERNAIKYAGLPASVQREEQRLRQELNKKRDELLPMHTNHSKYMELQSEVAILDRAYQLFIKKVETGFPRYHQLKFNNQVPGMDQLQRDFLEDEEAIIEYYWGTNDFYIFYISKESKTVFKKRIGPQIEEQVALFRNAIMDQNKRLVQQLAVQIYQFVWEDVEPKLSFDAITKVYLVPDAKLGLIPFDILKASDNAGYLIEKYQFSYQNSATLALQAREKISDRYSRTWAGFAPAFNADLLATLAPTEIRRSFLGPLPAAQDEVLAIAKMLDSKAFIGDTATETTFKKEAHKFRILHFASHAWADDKDPEASRLVFSQSTDGTTEDDGFLFPYEIYGMNLSAELVTLSACNTGYGKYYHGEGVLSLGKAFNYAGCPNILMSLWPVADASTAQIMTTFYDYLSRGYDKDQALREAKLAYLQQADGAASDPFYWAGFVFTGNTEHIFPKKTDYSQLMIIGGMVLLMLVLSAYYVRNNV